MSPQSMWVVFCKDVRRVIERTAIAGALFIVDFVSPTVLVLAPFN